MSLLEFLKKKGCTEDTVAVVDAKYAQNIGGSLDQLGVYESSREELEWDYGCTNLR